MGKWASASAIILLFVLVMGSGCEEPGPAAPTLSTPYQAVLLDDGQVYYGKLKHLGERYVTLRDVYYIQSVLDPKTRKAVEVLVERGREWHQPDYMVINPEHIVVIEPVGIHSRIALLIAKSKASRSSPGSTATP